MPRALSLLAAVAAAAVAAGCGFGPGSSSSGTATLTVTRDYGTVPMVEASVDGPDESETVLRMLDREADLQTRYGGGFVQAIDGVAGDVDAGRSYDWFFYVNGIESPIGSADRSVAGGDRVWWDHHDWTDVMRVPAVVGSWPEPFLQSSAIEDRLPVRVECATAGPVCERALERLADRGVSASKVNLDRAPHADAMRMLVGPWRSVRHDSAAAQIAAGPDESGVFARFEAGPEGPELVALDERAEPAARLGAGAGLIAAVREGEDPPTWVVSGVDDEGVRSAVEALDDALLADRYALAVAAGSDETLGLPVVEEP